MAIQGNGLSVSEFCVDSSFFANSFLKPKTRESVWPEVGSGMPLLSDSSALVGVGDLTGESVGFGVGVDVGLGVGVDKGAFVAVGAVVGTGVGEGVGVGVGQASGLTVLLLDFSVEIGRASCRERV